MTKIAYQSFRSSSGKPSWLQATLADLEQKMQVISLNIPEDEEPDSFAVRAENYYRKRPQLLNLLQDLYNRFVSLADRYMKTQSQITTIQSDIDYDSDMQLSSLTSADSIQLNSLTSMDSDVDVESSLSYQMPSFGFETSFETDAIITEFITRSIDNEILLHELSLLGRSQSESTRKIELQKSLLEVLESERLVLFNENTRLGFEMKSLTEENKNLSTETVFMKRKVNELTRCLLKMRDDHRVFLLSKKIDELQSQIFSLEKRNKEYHDLLLRREEEKREVVREVRFEIEKLKLENARLKAEVVRARESKLSKLWGLVRRIDFLVCGAKQSRRRR